MPEPTSSTRTPVRALSFGIEDFLITNQIYQFARPVSNHVEQFADFHSRRNDRRSEVFSPAIYCISIPCVRYRHVAVPGLKGMIQVAETEAPR